MRKLEIGLLICLSIGSLAESVELPRIGGWCCGWEPIDAFCARDCENKQCTDVCDQKCGFWGLTYCGSRKCSEMKASCGKTNPTKLLTLQSGPVYMLGDPNYEEARKVFNGACTAKPAAVVVPNTQDDISKILVFAKENNYVVSKRSGGHSYTCNSLVEGAIHVVLTNFNQVTLLDSNESPTGKAAWLGAGATWGKVLRVIDHEVYSYPHGQCRSVGVGGFLLGGGVNWLGTYNKYGYGAEYILKMKAVLADGSIVTVYPDRTEYRDGRVVTHTESNNLFNGLRGAGSSLAIVTDFLYRINLEPETRPAIVLIWIESQADMDKIHQAAKNTNDYSFMVNQPISTNNFWTFPVLRPLMNALPLALQALRLTNRKSTFPLQLMVTDIRAGAGKTTDVAGVINYLNTQEVSLVTDNFLNNMAMLPVAQALSVPVEIGLNGIMDRVGNYLYEIIEQEQESWKMSEFNSVSLNFGNLQDSSSYAPELLENQYVGLRRTFNLAIELKACDFCFWMIHFRNRQGQTEISKRYPISIRTDGFADDTQEINLTCMFKPGTGSCPQLVNDIKSNIYGRVKGTTYSKYYNFPSCIKEDSDWKTRYWGSKLSNLMSTKQYWDSQDVFQHCQSLTSTDSTCCPYSA